MPKKKKNKQEEKKIVKVLDCTFTLKLTDEEAYEIVHNKKGAVAKANKKYMNNLLVEIAKKCLAKCEEASDNEAKD